MNIRPSSASHHAFLAPALLPGEAGLGGRRRVHGDPAGAPERRGTAAAACQDAGGRALVPGAGGQEGPGHYSRGSQTLFQDSRFKNLLPCQQVDRNLS